MNRLINYTFSLLTLLILSSCSDYLDREPKDILLEEQVWRDAKLATSVLANLYDRLPGTTGFGGAGTTVLNVNLISTGTWADQALLDDAMWSGLNNDRNNLNLFPYNYWAVDNYWNNMYVLIRHINLFIENATQATNLAPADQKRFLAEGRFLRAFVYFDMVKRVGGVPLITRTFSLDEIGNTQAVRQPRNTEAQVYDFISSEIEALKNDLPTAASGKTRVTKWAALALKARAMLYAGSLAKYNSQMAAPITTPGGEVGIPATKAADYYTQSLTAAKEIISSGLYSLYRANPDRGENFYEALTTKANNPEVIFATDYILAGKFHNFTFDNIARSIREDNESSSSVTPSLNLVESYENLDGTPGLIKTRTADDRDYIYYNTPFDAFAGKDARLYGTVLVPGSRFRGKDLNVQAGVLVWNATTNAYTEVNSTALNTNYTDGKPLVGADGPLPNEFNVSNTGFYLKKYISSRAGAGQRGQGNDVWWVRYRYAEVLLNAAEAAFELGNTAEALTYINPVRERAGFGANNLKTLTIGQIQNERRVELAFEDHRLYDLKRWRLAHVLLNGDRTSTTAMIYGLWPYRVVRPGDAARDGKFVFIRRVPPRFRDPRFFRLGNYYSEIDEGIRNDNPLITRNPNQ